MDDVVEVAHVASAAAGSCRARRARGPARAAAPRASPARRACSCRSTVTSMRAARRARAVPVQRRLHEVVAEEAGAAGDQQAACRPSRRTRLSRSVQIDSRSSSSRSVERQDAVLEDILQVLRTNLQLTLARARPCARGRPRRSRSARRTRCRAAASAPGTVSRLNQRARVLRREALHEHVDLRARRPSASSGTNRFGWPRSPSYFGISYSRIEMVAERVPGQLRDQRGGPGAGRRR